MEQHLSENGLLIISNHGKFAKDRILSGEYHYGLDTASLQSLIEKYNTVGYGYVDYSGVTGYGVSIVSRNWIEGLFTSEQCTIVDYVERGWDHHHDVVFAKKKISCSAPSSY
jgi:hypothetical protein